MKNHFQVLDHYCAKISHIKHKSGQTELQRRTCPREGCYKYYPTLKALKPHTRICTGIDFDIMEDENLDLDPGDECVGYE